MPVSVSEPILMVSASIGIEIIIRSILIKFYIERRPICDVECGTKKK